MIMDVRIVIMTVKKETGRQNGVARMTNKTISHVSCAGGQAIELMEVNGR